MFWRKKVTKVITHIITTIEKGGAENQLLILAKQQKNQGFDINVIYLKGRPELKENFEKYGISVDTSYANKNLMTQVLKLKLALIEKKVIIHAHLPRAELVATLVKKENILIISKHNSEKFFPAAPFVISRLLANFVFKNADHCICISKSVLNYLKEIKEISDEKKTSVVYYGIDNSQEVDNDLGRSKNVSTIGTIGRLVEQKNYPVLLKAFKGLHLTNPHIRLLIVGDGKLKNKLKSLASDLGIADAIEWVGRTHLIEEAFRKMDVFVLPSIYEGFGLVLLEAMQHRVPIIASDVSAIPEVLGAQYKGLFRSNSDADLLIMLMKAMEPNFRDLLVSEYSGRLNFFDSIEMGNKISSIYSQILD